MTTNLAVLGSPIAHSKSPLLHAAAYAQLGLDWHYDAIEITGETLRDFVDSRDGSWRGLSLTMPLKRDVLPLLTVADELVIRTGGANTVLFDDGIRGFNTDVYGITEAFRTNGVESLGRVLVLGGGATAASAVVAAHELGATTFDVRLRHPMKLGQLQTLGADLDVDLTFTALDDAVTVIPDAVISTLPGHSEHNLVFAEELRATAVLFDVAYDPWPSALASVWLGTVVSGLDMLTLQALAQVRVFVNGDPDAELDNESTTTSELLQAHLPHSKVVKAFNHIHAAQLTTDGKPAGTENRRALVIAGDDSAAKATVTGLLDQFGFDTVDAGPLREGWRIQRDTPGYGPRRTAEELRSDLAAAKR